MLTFIVPVKSEKLAADWPAFCKLFERSLGSICNQESPDFKVVVVCHEIPKVDFESEKVTYIQVDFAPPTLVENDWDKNRALKEGDKAKKIQKGMEHARQYDPDHVMVVDSDDCVSNRIVSFVAEQDQNAPGWFVKKGYFYREGAPYVFLNKNNFNTLCGSCIIIRSDLFHHLFRIEPWLYYSHERTELPDEPKSRLKPLPFAAALYSMANGENHYMSVQQAKKLAKQPKLINGDFFRRFFKKLAKYRIRFLTPSFKRTFNFYKV
jgi:hypothetical protein